MKIPEELAGRLAAGAPETLVAYLTTASATGHPNTLAVPFTDIVDESLVLLPDLFAQKTKVNLNENHAAAMSFADENGSLPWLLEGSADIVQWGHPRAFRAFGLSAGHVLERWGDWDESVEAVIDAPEPAARPSVFAQRGVIVFKPDRIRKVSS